MGGSVIAGIEAMSLWGKFLGCLFACETDVCVREGRWRLIHDVNKDAWDVLAGVERMHEKCCEEGTTCLRRGYWKYVMFWHCSKPHKDVEYRHRPFK